MLHEARRIPGATYRLQLHQGFPFAQAEGLLPYLRELGVTECYCSPILLSGPGSTHGYDVNDYRKIDTELGGAEGFARFSAAARGLDLGILLDFVPNHMGINGPFNSWWRDVLASGPSSPYARFFDIYWNDKAEHGRRRVLVPILDAPYGRVLEAGRLQLAYGSGEFAVRYGEMEFPLSPPTYRDILQPVAEGDSGPPAGRDELRGFAREFAAYSDPVGEWPLEHAKARAGEIEKAKGRLAALLENSPELHAQVASRLQKLNGRAGEPRSFDALHAILEEQHYRLAHWKTGAHETNYRRFFAVDSLVGLRMEDPEVFRESHMLLGRLLREGLVTGLRIDHVDGLWDPEEYLGRLQALPAPADAGPGPLFVVVEKILEGREALPGSWAAHGTTGYEFISDLAGLLVRAESEKRFTEIYASFTGRTANFADIVYEKKRIVLEDLFPNAVNNLAAALAEILETDRYWRDLTLHDLTAVVREIMANFGIYRTYRRMDGAVSPADRAEIGAACARAFARSPLLDVNVFEFVRGVLQGDYPGEAASAEIRARVSHWALTFQQYTGAVMAKAVEDTAYYTYNRLIALNEVGGDPAAFGLEVAAFHAANAARQVAMPHSLLATSTHDTKLSEDTRARLYVLSELPGEWEAWVAEWSALNQSHKTMVDGRPAPDANEEYRLYQTLLAAWPLDDVLGDGLRERIRDYLRKAVNEGKENTTWRHPSAAWVEACDRFVAALLDEVKSAEFLASFRPKALRLAHLGSVNSLTQLVLKATCPGVPDFYQGAEAWDFSLVDPDNRRPVDHAAHAQLLEAAQAAAPHELLRHWKDGAIKLRVMQALLCFRREHAALFAAGGYQPLAAEGAFGHQVVAFLREGEGEQVLVVVPRLTARLACPPLGLAWDETAVRLPTAAAGVDVITGRKSPATDLLPLADLLADLPFAVLHFRSSPPAQ